VRCIRLYTDAAGNSRFDEMDIPLQQAEFGPPAAPIDLSEPEVAARVIFASIPPGWVGVRHTAPRRQYFAQLTGIIEVEVAEGERVRTGPGEVTLIEDTDGSGHITRVIGDESVTGAFIQLP
jgi:hypothetical protein